MSEEIRSAEDAKRWNQQQYAEALRYCQRNQLSVAEFDKQNSRVLPPLLAVWKVKLAGKTPQSVWIIGGKVMMDHADASVATNAREVLQYFSLAWQLKAERLRQQLEDDQHGLLDREAQEKIINTLITKAESLYELYRDDSLWGEM